jgi:hypothetical protein
MYSNSGINLSDFDDPDDVLPQLAKPKERLRKIIKRRGYEDSIKNKEFHKRSVERRLRREKARSYNQEEV